MENNKLDRLFREKAEHYEVQPSKDAWNQIAGQTSTASNNSWVWKVAASVILLIAVSLIFWQRSMDTPLEYAMMDFPPVPADSFEIHDFELSTEAVAFEPATTSPQEVQADVPPSTQQVAHEQSDVAERTPEVIPMLTLSTKKEVLAIEQPVPNRVPMAVPSLEMPMEDLVPEGPAVTIRYYADNTEVLADSTQGKKRFGNFLARAQAFQPGVLLADLRAAKDDLFRSKN